VSDATATPQPEKKPQQVRPLKYPTVPDAQLMAMVSFVETDPGNSAGITISHNGSVVSGNLVSRETWLIRVRELMSTASGTGADAVAELMEVVAESSDKRLAQLIAEGQTPPLDYFFHLVDVTIVSSGLHKVPVWRGQLSHVSGWSFGSVS
jgi:hypothetical protein